MLHTRLQTVGSAVLRHATSAGILSNIAILLLAAVYTAGSTCNDVRFAMRPCKFRCTMLRWFPQHLVREHDCCVIGPRVVLHAIRSAREHPTTGGAQFTVGHGPA